LSVLNKFFLQLSHVPGVGQLLEVDGRLLGGAKAAHWPAAGVLEKWDLLLLLLLDYSDLFFMMLRRRRGHQLMGRWLHWWQRGTMPKTSSRKIALANLYLN
jgi:hypothetical protein